MYFSWTLLLSWCSEVPFLFTSSSKDNSFSTQWASVTPNNPKPNAISVKNMLTSYPSDFLKFLKMLNTKNTFFFLDFLGDFNFGQVI